MADDTAQFDWQRRPLPKEISQRLLELERNQVAFQEAVDKFFPNGNFDGEAVRKALHSKNISSSLIARGMIDLFRDMADDMIEISRATVAFTEWDNGEMLNAAKAISRCVSNGALPGKVGTDLASHIIWPRNRLGHQRFQLLAEHPEKLDKALSLISGVAQGYVDSYRQWIEVNIRPEPPRPELSDLEPSAEPSRQVRRVVIDGSQHEHAGASGRQARASVAAS